MVFCILFFHKKRMGRQGFGEDSPAGRGKCREATKGDGARARGLSRPQRRDLAGLKNIRAGGLGDTPNRVKPAASNIPAPPGQGEKFQLGEAEIFKLCAYPGRAKSVGSVKL